MTDEEVYDARLGCLNCDVQYDVPIQKGTSIAKFLMEDSPICKKCGCDLLTKLDEWKAEKKIMKDMILHHRIQSMEGDTGNSNEDHDHYK